VPPAAVAEWWPQARVGEVLEAVAAPLAQALLRFEREGFAPLAAAFAERDALRGLRVNISNGQTGLADGVDASGALRLVTDTGPLVLTQHEVSVRPC
jgi:BirA family biotin operon repressor/biotin-[acetyl-CoA-carboxylase] ligase